MTRSENSMPMVPMPTESDVPLLIRRLLLTANRVPPQMEIVSGDTTRFSYGEFLTRIDRAAAAMEGLGISRGKTVGVMDWNSHRFLELFFAVPLLGATLHTVNLRLSRRHIQATIDLAEDDLLLVHESFLPWVRHLPLSKPPPLIVLSDQAGSTPDASKSYADYEHLLARADPKKDFEEFDEQTRATLFFTTGTTGAPKGVWFSHRQIVLHTLGLGLAASAYSGGSTFTAEDVYLPLTHMFHVHAWGFPYLATMLGVKQVFAGAFDPEHTLRLIDREGVTFTHCVPSVLHLLLDHPLSHSIDLSRLKVNTGGMALPRGLAQKAVERGIGIFHGYGLSESCPVLTLATLAPHMTGWPTDRQLDVLTRTGRPLPLVDLDICDEHGQSTPWDGHTTGEITVRAPWLTRNYVDDPDRTRSLWRGGRLHTGDRGFIDPQGYVQITDRSSDAIKSGGEWISSIELESLLSQHDRVSEVAVIGVPHERWGERPVAVIVPQASAPIRQPQRELTEFLQRFIDSGRLNRWAVPDRFVVADEIPKTSVGKIDKAELRRALQHVLEQPAPEGESRHSTTTHEQGGPP